jgi:hypothetical protein
MQLPSTFLTFAGLRARGWTPAMVDRLLGQPDSVVRNPRYRAAAPTRLYARERVRAAEGTPEFARLLAVATRRSAAAREAADRRRRVVLARIAALRIPVPQLSRTVLAERAVEHRNQRDEQRAWVWLDHVPNPASAADADPAALIRWQVNYLRHVLTDYDALLDGLFGATGRAEAERLLRCRVYEAIAVAYPMLREECSRQLAQRG